MPSINPDVATAFCLGALVSGAFYLWQKETRTLFKMGLLAMGSGILLPETWAWLWIGLIHSLVWHKVLIGEQKSLSLSHGLILAWPVVFALSSMRPSLFYFVPVISSLTLLLWAGLRTYVFQTTYLPIRWPPLMLFAAANLLFGLLAEPEWQLLVLISILAFVFQPYRARLKPETLMADEIEACKSQERSRIYANIHDDVGADLLELIYETPDERIQTKLRSILKKLRAAVAETLNVQWHNHRLMDEIISECQQRLDHTSVSLHIQQQRSEQVERLASTTVNNSLRIIREAISNALKHGPATEIKVQLKQTAEQLEIIVDNDGHAFPEQAIAHRGLKSIRKRAEAIQADVSWQSLGSDKAPQGTRFKLCLPVRRLDTHSKP